MLDRRLPFRQSRLLQGLVAWLAFFWAVTAIAPTSRFDWLLENLLVFTYAAVLVATYPRFRFGNTSYGLFTLFITLHLIGAHYTYSETPVGFWLQDLFGFSRNHYDRIVHFSYGLLIVYPFRELLLRVGGVRSGWAGFLAVNMVLAFSAFFEVLEAWIAMLVSPELGDAYLGTQGDIWDAQRDMGLALLGAIVTVLAIAWLGRRHRQ